MAEEDPAGFEVTRFIPVPTSVSDHAQQFLAMVFEAMPHGGFWGAPEDEDMAGEIRRFVAAHLPEAYS